MNNLYEEVAEQLATLIRERTLTTGMKIPSIRKLKTELGVSTSTILSAYALLEAQGLVEAKYKSGYVVKPLPSYSEPPAPPKTGVASRPLKNIDFIKLVLDSVQKADLYPFGAAVPDPSLLPLEELNKELALAARKSGRRGLEYDGPQGSMLLRKQLAIRSLSWGKRLSPEDFIVTTGAIEALSLALRAVASAGETVVVEAPAYFGMLQLIEAQGLKVLEVPVEPESGPDLDILEKHFRTKKIAAFLTVPNFHNPVGSLVPNEKKLSLVKLSAKYRVPIIEDDIYGDLYFGSKRPITLHSLDKNGLIILCSSVSKTLAPGYRVGWICGGKYHDEISTLKAVLNGKTPTLLQISIGRFMQSGAYDRHLKKVRPTYAKNILLSTEAILRYFPEGTKVSAPCGGFVLWIELPAGIDSIKLQGFAQEAQISIAPGPIFSARRKLQNFIRINCARGWSRENEEAIRKLGKLAYGLLNETISEIR